MPKRISAKFKRVYPCPPEKCNDKRHMPPFAGTRPSAVSKVWDVMRAFAFSHQDENNGQLIMSASIEPSLANATACTADTVSVAIAWLLEHDWLVLVEEGRHYPSGRVAPNKYRMRTHDEYVKLHPGSCPPNLYPDNEGTKPINVSAKSQSLDQLSQRLKHSPQAEPVRRIWAEMSAILENMSREERETWLESLKNLEFEAVPVQTGKVDNNDAVPVSPGTDRPGLGTLTVPVQNADRSGLNRENHLDIPKTNTHTTPQTAKSRVCDVLTSNPSTKGKQEESSPLVETVSAPRAAEIVGALFKRGDDHGNLLKVVGSNKKDLAALAMKYGETLFRKACDVFLKESPWNDKTIAPYKMLVDGFESYIGQVERMEQAKVDDAKQEIVKKASMDAAREKLAKQFGFDPKPTTDITNEDTAEVPPLKLLD